MLSDEEVQAIEASARSSADASLLRRCIDDLLRDRHERMERIERARQRLRPFAYFRDVINWM